jgi:uncharacterized protein
VEATPSVLSGNFADVVGARPSEWAAGLLRVLGLAPAVLLGAWAGRHRLLSSPEHRTALGWTVVAGLSVGIAGGVPAALMAATVWSSPATVTSLAAGALHLASGYAVAAAYLAIFALIGTRDQHLSVTRGQMGPTYRWLTHALVASGQRSLTLYLTQSALFLVILDPSVFGLGEDASAWFLFLIAVGIWLVTVVMAVVMGKLGMRGPAETFLRRMTYAAKSP